MQVNHSTLAIYFNFRFS